MSQTPYPYQEKIILGIRQAMREGHKRVLVNSPTGSGKTTIMANMTASVCRRGNDPARPETAPPLLPVWVIVHRRELVKQAVKRMQGEGLRVGYVDDGTILSPGADVMVLSVQTIDARLRTGRPLPSKKPRAVFVDEAHHVGAATWSRAVEHCGDAQIVMVTATPWRPDGGPIPFATKLVQGPWPYELVGPGLPLCPLRIFAGPTPALEGEKGKLDTVSFKGLDAPIVNTWIMHARCSPAMPARFRTLVFATTKDHARELVTEWKSRGFRAACVFDDTAPAERDAVLVDLAAGALDVVVNVGLFTEGFDLPSIDCVVLAMATESEAKYLQCVGRGARVAFGKSDCLILDHGRNTQRFGHPYNAREVTIDDGRVVKKPAKTEEEIAAGDGDGLRMCNACLALVVPADVCSSCGQRMAPIRLPKVNKKVTLVEQMQADVARAGDADAEVNRKRNRWRQLWGKALLDAGDKKRNAWWAVHAYRAAFGKPPYADGILTTEEVAELWKELPPPKRKRR